MKTIVQFQALMLINLVLLEGKVIYVRENSSISLNCYQTTLITRNNNGSLVILVSGHQLKSEYSKTFSLVTNVRNSEIILTIKQFSEEYVGNYTCIRDVPDDQNKDMTFDLRIQNAPYIDFRYQVTNSSRTLQCLPKGIPNNYTFYKWEHKTEDGDHIRYLSGDKGGNLVLPPDIGNMYWYKRRGTYVCSVSNGNPKQGRDVVTAEYFLNDTGKPHVDTTNKNKQYVNNGKIANISFHYFSVPQINNVTISTQGAGIIEKFDYREDNNVTIPVIISGMQVKIKGSTMFINLEVDKHDDFQLFLITISNLFGSSDMTIELKRSVTMTENGHELFTIITPGVVGILAALCVLLSVVIWRGKLVNGNWICFRKRHPLQIDEGDVAPGNNGIDNNIAASSNDQSNAGNVYSSVTRKPHRNINQPVSYHASQKKPNDPHQKPFSADETSCTLEFVGKSANISQRKIPKKSIQLNYAEVHIDPTPTGRRILISEENTKSPYADIDFSRSADLAGLDIQESDSDDENFCDVEELKRN